MTVKEYLYQTIALNKKIDALQINVERMESVVTKASPVISDMPKDPGRNIRSHEIAQTALIDMKVELNAEIDKFIELKKDVEALISNLDDSNQRLVMYLRYIEMQSWEQIAEVMDRTERRIYKIHGNALQNLQKYYVN